MMLQNHVLKARYSSWKSPMRARMKMTAGNSVRISGWSPTPWKVVTEALKLADVGPDDLVYDLGCGDGRVVVSASAQFGARAIGFDIDRNRVREARSHIRSNQVAHLAEVRRQDMRNIPNIHEATVIFLYLPQPAVNALRPYLLRRCSKGTRVVSVQTWIYHWQTKKELVVRGKYWKWHIGLWLV